MGKRETVKVSGGEEGAWKSFVENSGQRGWRQIRRRETGWCGIVIEKEITDVVFIPGPWHRASKALGISHAVGVRGDVFVTHNKPLSTAPKLHATERMLGGWGLAAKGMKHVTGSAPSLI